MKRKTNLFYTNGPDSKFLTFSNYTESLTGNFLSTNTKLFPDKFLCLKLNNLNKNTKSNFIKYLVRYYENKLAVIRDNCISMDIVAEQYELPLAYLLEAILNICSQRDNTTEFKIDNNKLLNQNKITKMSEINYRKIYNSGGPLITYIGNITEQDYNGTYTDTICTINANEYYEGDLNFYNSLLTSSNDLRCAVQDYTDKLYGWENETLFNEYIGVTPIYDDENTYSYNFNSYLTNIKYVKQPVSDGDTQLFKDIKFNVIIPLFTITNTNYNLNESILTDEYYIEDDVKYQCIILDSLRNQLDNIEYKSRKDVPLGIWMYADGDEDTFIELKRDTELQVYPSWSLLIGSQFKPFPYSLKYQKDNETNNSILHSYATFAETLTKINDTLDVFNQINTNISKLDERISSLERQIKTIGTSSDISYMKTYMLNMYKDVKTEIDTFKQQLYGYVDNITWSSKYKNNN